MNYFDNEFSNTSVCVCVFTCVSVDDVKQWGGGCFKKP